MLIAAVVAHGEGAGGPVGYKTDLIIAAAERYARIRERAEIKLVDRVGGVRYELAQEYFLMRVDGIDHHIEQLLRFGPELFL